MTERLRLTEKAYGLIELVSNGGGSYDEGRLANGLNRIDRAPSFYLDRSRSGPPMARGEVPRLVSLGYLDIYEDSSLDFLDRQMGLQVDHSDSGDYIRPEDLDIGPKGRVVMELMVQGISLPRPLYDFGKWMFEFENGEECPSWVLIRMYREELLVKSKGPSKYNLVEELGDF